MRFYNIIIKTPGGTIVTPASMAGLTSSSSYTSYVNGQSLPGALQVDLDIPITSTVDPLGDAWVKISGVSIQEIAQANNLVGNLIQIYGGFQSGLPLNNAAQAGLLCTGYIYQAWGNWEGTEQSLNLQIKAGQGPNGLGTNAAPQNIVLNWTKGMALGNALKTALSTIPGNYNFNVTCSSNIVRGDTQVGIFNSVEQLQAYARAASKAVINQTGYSGVTIELRGNTFYIYDSTQPQSNVINILFSELIGQPTWIESPTINFKCPMRTDIRPGGFIKLPPTSTISSPQSQSQQRSNSVFQGTFYVQSARHIGNFRGTGDGDWVTVFDANPNQGSST